VEAKEDPLAELRQGRGWIDCVPEAELWERLRRVRWANGLRCPHCGETDPSYLEVIDWHYRGGMYRYCCQVCHGAGDPGEGGTFTDLTGTLFDGCRLDIRSLWLIVEAFVNQAAAVETADEVQVNRHTVDRYFRLLRAAIYQARPDGPLALGPEDIVERLLNLSSWGVMGAGQRPSGVRAWLGLGNVITPAARVAAGRPVQSTHPERRDSHWPGVHPESSPRLSGRGRHCGTDDPNV